GVLTGVGVEGALDVFALIGGRGAAVDGDAVERVFGGGDGGAELLLQGAQRVLVFGKDNDAGAVPRAAEAHVGGDPFGQVADASVGGTPAGIGEIGHLLEEVFFLGMIGWGVRGGGGGFHFRIH